MAASKGLLLLLVLCACAQCVTACSLSSASLSCSGDPSFPMKINCDLTGISSAGTVDLEVVYQAADIAGSPALSVNVSASSPSLSFSLFRVAPVNQYNIIVLDSEDPSSPCALHTTAVTLGTGLSYLDDGPLVEVNGSLSAFDMLVYDRQNTFYAFDSTGWAVWQLGENAVMPNQPSFCQTQHEDYSVSCLFNSTIMRYTPDNQRLVAGAEPYEVLTFQQTVVEESIVEDLQIVTQLMQVWNAQTNEMRNITTTLDLFNPHTQQGKMSKGLLRVACYGDEYDSSDQVLTTDWSHDNAMSLSPDGSKIILGFRALSAIVQADAVTGKMDWMVSSEFKSNFTFVDESDKWYNQHFTLQLASGNFLMIDNGNSRPSETQFSRALEVSLDMETMTVRKVWEFHPGIYSAHAGVAVDLANGNRLAAFSCDMIAAEYDCDMLFWVLDMATNEVVATMRAPRSDPNSIGAYRAEPRVTINGERQVTAERFADAMRYVDFVM